MNIFLTLSLVFIGGSLLGVIFFVGLWLTLKWGLQSNFAALWLPLSFIVRASLVLGGVYWLGQDQWQRFAACLLGFIIMRLLLIRWLARISADKSLHNQQAKHAS